MLNLTGQKAAKTQARFSAAKCTTDVVRALWGGLETPPKGCGVPASRRRCQREAHTHTHVSSSPTFLPAVVRFRAKM